jgi:hypothetical protein
VATTEGYASRPGGAQAELLAEVNQHESERNLALLWDEFRNYQNGIMPAGPGARELTDFFARVDANLDPAQASAAKVQRSDREIRSLLTKRAGVLHLGTANYCWLSKVLDNQHYGDQAVMPRRARGRRLRKGVHAGVIGIIFRRSREVTYPGARSHAGLVGLNRGGMDGSIRSFSVLGHRAAGLLCGGVRRRTGL